MNLFVVAVCVILGGSLLSLLSGKRERLATGASALSTTAGCAIAAVPVFASLAGWPVEPIHWPWDIPWGSLRMEMDGLSAWFMLPIILLSPLAAIYGRQYMRPYEGRGKLASASFFFNLLIASMMVVVVARNGLLFLLAWEAMSLASFFLVTFDNEDAQARNAGWTYLVATHLGTAFLLVMFLMLGRANGSGDFDQFTAVGFEGVAFLMAVVGFGTKAGFVPMHVWLPEAHPAAPSHVSAVMSGAMIKTGIYGILRTLTFLGPPAEWWGWTLVGIGVVSGVLGVLLALAQHDLKRLLAYHSVENIGIIAIGLGLGVIGLARGNVALAALGFAGGLLHVVNHAIFKGLLFLGAGAVMHATGTREIDRLGGLAKKMPWTAATFLVGSAAISALPPLNGFVSEFLIYFGSFRAVGSSAAPGVVIPALVAIGGLALIGGLAAACFTKAFGVVFLGEARTPDVAHAHEAPAAMRAPMIVLAFLCVMIGVLCPLVVGLMGPAVASATGLPLALTGEAISIVAPSITWVALAATIFLAVLAGLILLRRLRFSKKAGRQIGRAGTWDCGYVAPTARMQYTASSFAAPLTSLFRIFLRTHKSQKPVEGLFPQQASLETHTPDILHDGLYKPAFMGMAHLMGRLRWLQHGRLQLYVLYIVLTLMVLLAWRLG